MMQPIEAVKPGTATPPLPARPAKKGAPLELISHWSKLLEGLQFSPMEFYSQLRSAIEKRDIPRAKMVQVEWPEGGILSAKRIYLRVTRREHVFDVCAAPFGNGFFVSWWLGRTQTGNVLYFFALVIAIIIYTGVAFRFLGFWGGLIAVFVGLPAIFGYLVKEAAVGLDQFLLEIPMLGDLYERLFHPITFYRIDTALMFQSAVHSAVLEVIDGLTKAKGIRALSEAERKPIMREFFTK